MLLSGGSGKRLWPLSNEIRSKAFLKLLRADDGSPESMIQRVCRQLEAVGLLAATSIVAHDSQVGMIRNHVGEQIPVISEPFKRGTFTAIALAAASMHTGRQADPDETICVLPVDSFADSSFFGLLHVFPQVLAESGAQVALLGTSPQQPSDQFGYIVPAAGTDNGTVYRMVTRFVEKPEEREAAKLIQANALWNCGVFAFSLRFMLAELAKKGLPLDHGELLGRYERLPELGFDQEVVEKASRAAVIPYNGTWRDLGSWEAMTSYVESNVTGPGQISEDSVNTHVVNELAAPIQVIDVPNIIVAASPDGILVASKQHASRIKEKLSGFPQTIKYEEKRWGSCRVLDQLVTEAGIEVSTRKLEVHPGKHTSYGLHRRRKKIWTVAGGAGELLLDGQIYSIQQGDVLQIPCGAKHGVRAVTALDMIEIQIGSGLGEDDVEHLAATWEESLRLCRQGDPPA
ncbi:sugar phosphate nucleotidyltransferase [Paenibacillus filicis]|uniref:Sugar phosphate nucleotidyltransferase n=1 Tax=Paenibacillus filicis TaxID=669464 RepID=A0ABU9DLW3_9BACL